VIGTTISHYRILEKLGEGGMGVVYKAQDVRLERLVALKVLPDGLAMVPSLRERFVHEARAASALNHPNVAVIYDVGDDGQRSFIVMELIEGETLRARLRTGPVTIEQVRSWSLQLADGLRAAHAKGIVHRDIKPDNLLIASSGRLKILDFGIARLADSSLTATGATLGTVAYMSPEQTLGEKVDHRSDLWSLGVVMYEMLAGRGPTTQQNPAAIVYEILNREPPPVESVRKDTPAWLAELVAQLLQKDPTARPASAAEVVAALEAPRDEAGRDVPEKSIAVLYFENMSPDAESEYYCAGITEDILTDLSKVEDLSVVSRTDMLPFRGKAVNVRQVAAALRVNYVLEGSVRKAGQRVRITAQLIDARNGYHVWADRFDGLLDDIFDLQAEVASQIARAMKGSLTEADQATLARRPTDDVRAYDFYMRGREYLNRRGKANTEAAIRMFESALSIDGGFADASAALGEACAYMYEWYDGSPDWLSRAITTNQDALDRDPRSVEALFGIGMVYFHQGRPADAQRTLRAVLDANPHHVTAMIRLGMLAERTARDEAGLDEALARYRQAAELRPNEEEAWQCLAAVHQKLGHHDAAQDAALNVIEITARKLEASLEDVILLSRLGEAYARVQARVEAGATVQRVLELAPADGLAVYHCAAAYGLLGESDRSLALLRQSHAAGFRGVMNAARTDSAFETLRGEPGFRRLVAELG